MYKIVTVREKIKVTPEKLDLPKEEAISKAIEENLEGLTDPKLGMIFLSLVSIDNIGEGKIYPADPNIYYLVTFKMFVYKPELHELVIGEVVDNTDFGSFVRIGPIDGLVHISQLMDDYVSFDKKNSVFLGKQTKKTLKIGDKVLARIISISWKEQNKIGLTMRQAGLGALHWLKKK
ncbi:MAG: DNA-directed RNA polymerase [Candidatus Aenigmatarchaeota archaeon]|jgi:DNA-directed RNA polymerase subunit E'